MPDAFKHIMKRACKGRLLIELRWAGLLVLLGSLFFYLVSWGAIRISRYSSDRVDARGIAESITLQLFQEEYDVMEGYMGPTPIWSSFSTNGTVMVAVCPNTDSDGVLHKIIRVQVWNHARHNGGRSDLMIDYKSTRYPEG